MRFALLLTLVSLTALADRGGRFERFCSRTAQGRSDRGLQCDDLPFFSAFDTNGLGTTTACSTTPPTGAKGEALTFARASTATCTKTATGGLATTGIADGDLVLMASGQPRVMYDSAGTLGLGVEAQGVNLLPRYNDLTNAAWSDVGTPTVTDGATDPFGGTTGDTIDDNDAAAYEGRSQTITVAAGVAHLAYCYVKAGTATTARIVLDGTAATITGLSPTTWSVLEVADASSSGVAIAVQVLVGNATTVTGTVVWGGCDVKAGTYRTSIVPTVGASATRVAETASFNGSTWPVSPVSVAVSVTAPWSGTGTASDMLYGNVGSNSGWAFGWTGATLRTQPCAAGACSTLDVAQGPTAGVTARWAFSYSGTATSIYKDSTLIAGPTAKTAPASPWSSTTGIGSGGYGQGSTILSRICVDPARCTP